MNSFGFSSDTIKTIDVLSIVLNEQKAYFEKGWIPISRSSIKEVTFVGLKTMGAKKGLFLCVFLVLYTGICVCTSLVTLMFCFLEVNPVL
mgnify:CR=1 FL=1